MHAVSSVRETRRSSPARPPADEATFVCGIVAGETSAFELLYHRLRGIVASHRRFRLPEQDTDDLVHEFLPSIVENIRGGDLRDVHALNGYLHSVVRKQVAGKIIGVLRHRARLADHAREIQNRPDDPERACLRCERKAIIARGIERLQERDGELLRRFYLLEEDHDVICREMHLTENQFRVYKSRAKAKLVAWVREAAT